jgi:hypothetical protein
MLSSRFFSRVFTHGLMPVLAGCLALPLEVNGQADPTAQVRLALERTTASRGTG